MPLPALRPQKAAVLAKPRCGSGKREGLLLPEVRVAELGYVLLSALIHMNRQGYAHCDIKPENVFVMADGSFRLGDPGVACAANASGVLEHDAGTLYFISPEMWRRFTGKACPYPVTLKTDVYSVARLLGLCAVWYDEMVSWEQYMKWEKELPDCVPAGLQELIASMVEEDPTERPSPLEALDNKWLVGTLRGDRKEEGQQQQEDTADEAGTAPAATAVAEGPSPADAWW